MIESIKQARKCVGNLRTSLRNYYKLRDQDPNGSSSPFVTCWFDDTHELGCCSFTTVESIVGPTTFVFLRMFGFFHSIYACISGFHGGFPFPCRALARDSTRRFVSSRLCRRQQQSQLSNLCVRLLRVPTWVWRRTRRRKSDVGTTSALATTSEPTI
jgi:hypothetical protein